MSAPSQWAAFEAEHGRPGATVLIDALHEAKSVRGAAKLIRRPRTTLSRWCRKAGIDPVAETLKAKLAEAA